MKFRLLLTVPYCLAVLFVGFAGYSGGDGGYQAPTATPTAITDVQGEVTAVSTRVDQVEADMITQSNRVDDLSVIKFSLTIQDPTNSLTPYFMAMPFSVTGTLTEVFVQSYGVTGLVDIVVKPRANNLATFTTIDSNIIADQDGTADASFTGSDQLTNDWHIGFLPKSLPSFAFTNKISVDFEVSVP